MGPQAGQLSEPLRPSWECRYSAFPEGLQTIITSPLMRSYPSTAVLTRPLRRVLAAWRTDAHRPENGVT
jgi:hypothetical protein